MTDLPHESTVRVCIVCASLPPFYGGAELRAYRFAQRLQTRDDVKAILIGWDRLGNRTPDQSLPAHVHAVRLGFQRSENNRTASVVRKALHITEIGGRVGLLLFHLRNEVDVVHIFNAATFFNLVPIPIARALDKPVILEMTLLGSDDPLKLNKRSKHHEQQLFPHRPLKYSLFLKADAYVSKSTSLTQAYRKAGLPEEKLFQIPSGVDTERFCPPKPGEKADLRNRLGLPTDRILILFVGGIEERKGAHRLLAAFQQIALRHPQAHLVIVGPTDRFEPSYVQRIRRDILAWGLRKQVTFREGLAENVDEYMKAADILALPSSREGFSMAILEAMACGLAVVASDIPEVAGCQVEPDQEGLLIPVGDIPSLANALSNLADDSARREQLGRAARRRVLQDFTDTAIDLRYIELFRYLLSL